MVSPFRNIVIILFSVMETITGHVRVGDKLDFRDPVKKCCPWGAYFDPETLTCEITDRRLIGDLTTEEIATLEASFLRRHVGNYVNGNYRFSLGVLPCDENRVFTSQITTEFTLESGIPKLDGNPIREEYCIDDRNGTGTVLLRCQHHNYCKTRPCIRKCRPYGDFFNRDREGVLELPKLTREFYNLDTMQVDKFVTISAFGVFMGNSCATKEAYLLDPESEPSEIHYLGSDGRLHVPDGPNLYYTNREFCIENAKDGNVTNVYTFVCFAEPTSKLTYYLLAGCFLVSCVFLLATFFVYLLSPRMRTLYGKSLMCYVTNLFGAYLTLAIVQLNADDFGDDSCTFAGYAILFFFMAAFFWLNIMTIDMWKAFRSTRSARLNRKGNVQFLWYSLYSWTMAILLTGLTAIADHVPGFASPGIIPGIGNPDCWFSRYTNGIYVFFITPVSIVILVNTVLFVDTAWRCWKIKSKVIRMGNHSKKKYAANRNQMIINAKLFIVMGVVWGLEVLSTILDHPIWYISDAANALHGVIIFALFVMKKKVLAGLRHRFRKPFIRMRNIRKKSGEEMGQIDDTATTTTTTANKNCPRTSSTDVSI